MAQKPCDGEECLAPQIPFGMATRESRGLLGNGFTFDSCANLPAAGHFMSMRIAPDKNKPSVAIEIPLTKPMPDYDLDQVEQPTPRDIDGILVSQGFRDLVDDARGILTDLVAHPPAAVNGSHFVDLDLTGVPQLEIVQLTGAICPGDEEVYRPGLWIVLNDKKAPPNRALGEVALEHIRLMVSALVKNLGL